MATHSTFEHGAPSRAPTATKGHIHMHGSDLTVLIGVIAFFADLSIKIAALIVIPRERKPSAAMAWLLAIFLIPFVGILFFLILGSPKLGKKRRDKQKEINRMITEALPAVDLVSDRTTWPSWFPGV